MPCRWWICLKRFGHRRGYGVHSPFAFDFLTYVVYERGEYYAYGELKRLYPVAFLRGGQHRLKCRKFLFRLSNHVRPSVIRLCGGVEAAEAAYLSAGCRRAEVCREAAPAEREAGGSERKELAVVGSGVAPGQWIATASRPASEDSVCVISGIRASDEALQAWERVKMLPEVAVTFDLYDYGIVFYDRSKQRQDYIVRF